LNKSNFSLTCYQVTEEVGNHTTLGIEATGAYTPMQTIKTVTRRVLERLQHNLKIKAFFGLLALVIFAGLITVMGDKPRTVTTSYEFEPDKVKALAQEIEPAPAFNEPIITMKVIESDNERIEREKAEQEAKTRGSQRSRDVVARSVTTRIEAYSGGDAQDFGRQRVAEVWGESEWPAFREIIQRESGWKVGNRNTRSGACGLGQALPCSKLGSNYGNPEGEVNWVIGYISARYKTPNQALAFHNAHGWY
jgi:hypothetical protein